MFTTECKGGVPYVDRFVSTLEWSTYGGSTVAFVPSDFTVSLWGWSTSCS